MPRYLIQRQFHVGQERMPEVGRRSRQVIETHFPQITWEHSHVAMDDGGGVKTFCVYQAPSEDDLLAHAQELGMHNVESIYEIAGDVTPADFPI